MLEESKTDLHSYQGDKNVDKKKKKAACLFSIPEICIEEEPQNTTQVT